MYVCTYDAVKRMNMIHRTHLNNNNNNNNKL